MTDAPASPHSPSDEEGISLKPLISGLWADRQKIVAIVVGVALLYAIGASLAFLQRPSDRTASVSFRLVFDGADRGEYPNGTRFSRSDVIASPVLTQVYERNELQRYLPFEQFKSALFVFERSAELDMLNLEYQAKLSDKQMPAPQRALVEAEFRQKLDALRVPQLSLQFMVGGRSPAPPDHVMEKVLNDVLAVWAEMAATQKGAMGYQIEMLTPNVILKDTLNTQTMLIRYDLLRRHVGRILAQVGRLSELPGATTSRVGKDKLSLIDLRTSLDDLLEFQLNPLIKRRLIYALSPAEVSLNILYLEDRLLELERIQETAVSRKKQLEAALQTFAADASGRLPNPSGAEPSGSQVTPQLGNSFLDSLMDLSRRSGALDYRKELTDRIIAAGEEGLEVEQDIAFYQETLRLLRTVGRDRNAVLRPEDVVAAFEQIQKRVVDVLTLTNEAYTTISAANLNPRSVLYRLAGPYSVQTVRTVTARSLAMLGVVILVVTTLLVVAFFGGRAMLRHSRLLS